RILFVARKLRRPAPEARKSFRHMALRPKAGVLKKVSYIQQTEGKPKAKYHDAKRLSLHSLRLGSNIAASDRNWKCNARFTKSKLSPTGAIDSIFNFLISLQKLSTSLQATGRLQPRMRQGGPLLSHINSSRATATAQDPSKQCQLTFLPRNV